MFSFYTQHFIALKNAQNSDILKIYQYIYKKEEILWKGADFVKLFGETVQVKAEIKQLEGISSHADKKMLLEWISLFQNKPKTIFVNHGSDKVWDEFAQIIEETLATYAIAPYNGAEYDLITGVCINNGNTNRIENTSSNTASSRKTVVFKQLLSAGKRLMGIIENYKDATNKDIAKLTSQITSLCDKWEK